MQYATKATRMGAFLIDCVVIGLIVLLCSFISYGLGLIVCAAGEVLYFGFMEGSTMHGTLGKYLMGIVTVDENGQPIDYGKSLTRAVCRLLSGVIFGTGFLIGLFDEEGKTLHDRIAGTRVIAKISMGQSSAVVYGNSAMQQMGLQQPVQAVSKPVYSSAQPKVVGVVGNYAGQAFLIGPQGMIMGREQNACDFVFAGDVHGISRVHCKIQFNQQTGMFVIYDLGSSYGTFLANGVRVLQGQPMAIQPGGQFYLGDRGCTFMVNL